MAFVKSCDLLGMGVVVSDSQGHLKIHNDIHNTDICYVIEYYNYGM